MKLYAVYRRRFEGCGYHFIEYVSDRVVNTNQLSSVEFPNPLNISVDARDSVLVGILRQRSALPALESELERARLLVIPVGGEPKILEEDLLHECSDNIVWLTTDEEGRRLCRQFPGSILVVSAPLNLSNFEGFVNNLQLCQTKQKTSTCAML